ncbi:MAG: DUF494 family protein [bacterium]
MDLPSRTATDLKVRPFFAFFDPEPMVNENLIDVLIFIYENYMDSDDTIAKDQIMLEEELLKAGFAKLEIDSAFDWLDELARRQTSLLDSPVLESESIRIYSDQEQQYFDLEIQGLLHYLMQAGILNPVTLELVIERAMALKNDHLEVDDIKWIVLLVLLNQPGQENAIALMEEIVYNGDPGHLH